MHIEYIGVEEAELDNAFTGSEALAMLLNKRLKDETFLTALGNTGCIDDNYYYRTFDLVDGEPDYKVRIESLHENGVAVRLTCAVDTGINKYNVASSGLLILKDKEAPKFIITEIDARQNKHLVSDKTSVWAKVNEEKTNELLNGLGKRIDTPYLVGPRPKNNILTKKHNQKEITEVQNKLYEKLGYFTDYVDSFDMGEEKTM